MSRLKGSKNKHTRQERQVPAPVPETTDFQPPFTEKEIDALPVGGPLEDGETPKATRVPQGEEGPCQACVQTSVTSVPLPHTGALHYGSAQRWCNAAGCRCQAYRP